MPPIRFGGGEPSALLRQFLEQEDVGEVSLWIHRPGDPPDPFPHGPWLVLTDSPLGETERQNWLAALDEESSLLEAWTPASLRRALKPSMLDSTRLARLYAQGGRALADHMVRNFLQHSPGLLQLAQSEWDSDRDSSMGRLQRLHELAGGVGASELQELIDQPVPDWPRLQKELESARRVFDNQHRQDRTV
ncbi:hypothetical protein JST97_28735 [bacterium]|nr:hypothetical protein [bacterium]